MAKSKAADKAPKTGKTKGKSGKRPKDGAAGGAQDAAGNSTRLPKRVAGIKLPRDLRESGGKLIEAANSPVGRQLIAAGMAALATAAARAKPVREAAADATEATVDAAKATAEAGATQTSEIVDAMANLASAALQRLFEKKR